MNSFAIGRPARARPVRTTHYHSTGFHRLGKAKTAPTPCMSWRAQRGNLPIATTDFVGAGFKPAFLRERARTLIDPNGSHTEPQSHRVRRMTIPIRSVSLCLRVSLIPAHPRRRSVAGSRFPVHHLPPPAYGLPPRPHKHRQLFHKPGLSKQTSFEWRTIPEPKVGIVKFVQHLKSKNACHCKFFYSLSCRGLRAARPFSNTDFSTNSCNTV